MSKKINPEGTYFAKMTKLSNNFITSATQTAVVEKYIAVVTVLVYRRATVYAAATSVITSRQYSLNTRLTFSGGRKQWEEILIHSTVGTRRLRQEPRRGFICPNLKCSHFLGPLSPGLLLYHV